MPRLKKRVYCIKDSSNYKFTPLHERRIVPGKHQRIINAEMNWLKERRKNGNEPLYLHMRRNFSNSLRQVWSSSTARTRIPTGKSSPKTFSTSKGFSTAIVNQNQISKTENKYWSVIRQITLEKVPNSRKGLERKTQIFNQWLCSAICCCENTEEYVFSLSLQGKKLISWFDKMFSKFIIVFF